VFVSVPGIYISNTGLEKGIQYLSNAAMILSFAMLVLILIVGPTMMIIKIFFNTTGLYINDFIQMSLRMTPFGKGEWIASWTLFYWAWWIAWAPFVGMFIARISRGKNGKRVCHRRVDRSYTWNMYLDVYLWWLRT
jgi:glycine betaine transporter